MADAAAGPAAKGKGKKKTPSPFKLMSVESGSRMTAEEKQRYKRYDRGEGNSSRAVGNHKLKQKIKRSESKIGASAKAAAQAELRARRQRRGATIRSPSGLSFDPHDGTLWVASYATGAVTRFNSSAWGGGRTWRVTD